MEKIPERALRFVTDDFKSPLENLSTKTNLTLLNANRIKLIAKETYKILHKQSPFYIQNLVNFMEQTYNFRREMQAYQPNVTTTKYMYGLISTRYEAPRIWNSLANEIRQADNYRFLSDCSRPGRILYATV
jgi:hypothetical protein